MGFFSSTSANSTKNKKSSFFNSPEFDIEGTNRQIQNAQMRIKDSGYKTEDSDSRNWFEKATNLPEKQNFFFDTLEILARPSQGILNPLSKMIKGEDQNITSSFFKGLSGQEKVRGSDIVDDLGMENKFGKAVLGTGLEIGLDPVSYIPGGVLLKGAKLGSKAVTAPLRGAYNLAEKASPTLKKLREEVIQPTYETAKDRLGYAFNDDYKATETLSGSKSNDLLDNYNKAENKRRYLQDEYSSKLINSAKITGVGAGEQVGRVMEAPLRQFEDVKGYEFPDGLRRTTDKSEVIDAIGQNKSMIGDASKGIRNTNKQYQSAINEFGTALDDTNKQISKLYFNLERSAGKEMDAATKASMRQARTEANRLDSQINNFGQVEGSMVRDFKKQIRDEHEMNFNILKEIRRVAPNGIKAVGFDLPEKLQSMNRLIGKGIDEVADELGYKSANDLLQTVKKLDGLPRKLSQTEIEARALKEMDRVGGKKHLDETLQGLKTARDAARKSINAAGKVKKSSTLQGKAFASLSNNPEYQTLNAQKESLQDTRDTLRNESKALKQTSVNKIRDLQESTNKLRETLKNPVMIQKEVERIAREMPKDPKITQAAANLIKSNAELRALAESEGIPISEIEGYMSHILSQEEKKKRKLKPVLIDQGNFGLGQPNKSILNQRKLMGSAEDVNEQTGRKFFEPNAYFATAQGQRRLIDYIQSVSFRKNVLNDRNFAVPYKKGMEVPNNAVVIDTNNYKFIKESGDLLEAVASKDIGGQYVVTKAAKQKLDKYKHAMTDEGSKAFLNTFDAMQSFWKRAALFSIPYHLRNDVGAKFNNWVGGMSQVDIVKYSREADVTVYNAMTKGKETPLYNEYRQQGLGASSQSQVEFARRGVDPDKAIEKLVKEGSKDLKGKVKDRLNPLRAFETSREFGDFIDQTNRFAAYKWAREKLKLSPEDAAKKTKELQFDYTKLSNFERDFAARAFPFYRWMRNNIPYQIKQFTNDPRKYANINKLRLNAQGAAGIDEENVPDWMKESFSLAVSSDGKGSGKMLGFNLPLGDITKLANPLKMAIDSSTPVAKLPLELGINRNLFYNKPIEKFEGQAKQFSILGQEFNVAIKTAYALEQSTGQIGRGLSGFLTKPEEKDQDTKFRMPSFGISGVLKDFDANKATYFQLRNKLKELQDYINYIEQQTGERPQSVNDIKKVKKSSFFS